MGEKQKKPETSKMSKLGRLFGVSSSSLHLLSLHEKDKDRQKSPERQQLKTPDREKWLLLPLLLAPQSPHGVLVAEFAKIASPPIPEDDVLYPLPADRKANATLPSGASVNSDSNGTSANSYDHLVHPQPLMLALHDGFAQKLPPSSRPLSANSHQAPRKTSGLGPSGLLAPPASGLKLASVLRSLSAKRKTPQSTLRSLGNVLPLASQTNLPAAPQKLRFKMIEDGYHEHNLRATKRQEKLSNMLKDLLGAKKLRDEAKLAVPNILSPVQNNENKPDPEKPPTLFAGLVHQVKNNTSPYQVHGELLDPMSQQDCRSFVEKYGRCQEVIGKGSFGVVRVAHKKVEATSADEVLYAVKEFKRRPNESEKKYSRRLTSEFCISSSLKHLNIIDTLDLLKDAKGDYCEVMEFCSGGDLYTLIIAAGKLEYAEADCFFKQLIRGVNYMHDMGVAHRDLKPENLLLTQQGVLKITDFGNGECFKMAWEEEIQLSEGICGSSPYIAPEEFTQESFDPRCVDIWACGVIYMAMRTGRQLWKLADPKKDEFFQEYLTKRKDATGYEPIEALKRARCRNVIYSILDPMPNRRINGKQILNSEWGREIKVCAAGDGQLQASVLNGVLE